MDGLAWLKGEVIAAILGVFLLGGGLEATMGTSFQLLASEALGGGGLDDGAALLGGAPIDDGGGPYPGANCPG